MSLLTTKIKKGYEVFRHVKPLVETIKDLCSYIDLQIYNLEKVFKLSEPLNEENARKRRQIGSVLVGSVVGTLTSSVFTSIYNALTGVPSDSKELIGIVDDHEDRLSRVEKDLAHLNNSIESIKNLVIRTRSASQIMATLQVVIHSQFLSLSALKTHL